MTGLSLAHRNWTTHCYFPEILHQKALHESRSLTVSSLSHRVSQQRLRSHLVPSSNQNVISQKKKKKVNYRKQSSSEAYILLRSTTNTSRCRNTLCTLVSYLGLSRFLLSVSVILQIITFLGPQTLIKLNLLIN